MKLRNYKYEALDINNKLIKGHYESISQYSCLKYLESKSLKVQKITEKSNLITKFNQITISNVLKRKQLVFFLKQLSSLIDAGISIMDALEILALQQNDKYLRRLFFELHQNITDGLTFSEALAKRHREFPQMLVSMIEIGEVSGSLSETVQNMAEYYQKQMKLSSSIKSTVRMPIVYLLITLAVAIGMVLFVFPNITDLFNSFDGAKLPSVTIFFLNMSYFVGDYYLYLLFAILLIFLILHFLNKYIYKFKLIFSVFLLKIPVFGTLIQMYNQILIANTLSQMLSNGINSLSALESIKSLLTNVVYIEVIEETIKNITDGKPFSKSFQESNFIDPIMSRMIATGENTSDISGLMVGLANYYDEMSDTSVEKIKSALQPILLIIIYALITVMLLALMLPLLDLGGQI